MKTVLFCIPLKRDSLKQYIEFAQQTVARAREYSDMLSRYDIYCAKIWHKNISNCDYILVYHEVGPSFEEKMQNWENSTHSFDKWFRESIMAVYDIENIGGMQKPHPLVNFTVSHN